MNDKQGELKKTYYDMTHEAEKIYPGIIDLVQTYGGYEQTITMIEEYLGMTQITQHLGVSTDTHAGGTR